MRLRTAAVAAALGWAASQAMAQVSSAGQRLAGARLTGVVYDSIGRGPLTAAWVQLVADDRQATAARSATTDSVGRFAFEDIPDGRYRLGFYHPMLDSLGVEPPSRVVTVARHRDLRADLAIPSGGTLGAIICGVRAGRDSGIVVAGAAVAGVVRDARTRLPADGATVIGEWLELQFIPGQVRQRRPRLVVSTETNGWYALCNAPVGGTIFLSASRGTDSTDVMEAVVPADGFLRRDLYVGSSRIVAARDARDDSLTAPTRRVRIGEGRLAGVVVTAEGSRPLTGAQAHLTDGPAARADETGAWTIGNAPTGSRMLEVRAVGFYPVRRAVDVVDGALPVHLSLSTFKAVLDTVKIIATQLPDRHLSGFEERQRTGLGRFYTAADLERRGVIETSDLFRNVPGVQMRGTEIYMRSAFSTGSGALGADQDFYCRPSVYLDGLQLFEASADEIDVAVPARKVRAIEVYTDATVPPQFTRGLTGCGSIVIWTK